jgi:integrative and conjugative element protein (TIGR02256 family)
MENSLKFSLNSINFQREGSSIVSITFSALSEMRDLARSSQDIECGGILVGHNVGRDIEVVAASGAGPNAKQSAAHFLRDTGYCREFLARRYQESGADYVGEWHSHVVGLHHLSAGDLNTLVGILVDPDYDFVSFAVVLVIVGGKDLELLVYVAETAKELYRRRIVISELYRGKFPEPTSGAPDPESPGTRPPCPTDFPTRC